jgi:hypothetical protein
MQKLSFYEQVGVVTPGTVFLFGLIFYVPELRGILAKDGISVGGLGVFVILSYAAGHLLAAFGNVIEKGYWRAKGGYAVRLDCWAEAGLVIDCSNREGASQSLDAIGVGVAPLKRIEPA